MKPMIRQAATTVYLSLGSNLGDRAANLRAAIAALPAAGLTVTRVSSFYETEPVDYLDQPWFLNCVLRAETERVAVELLRDLRAIETRLGSQKEFAKGPRLLDIDILLYGGQFIDTPELQVPHPRMLQRKFVLAPLAEIAPQVSHPAWHGITAEKALQQVPDAGEVKKLSG
jgi:2-amino-4-hydroxy-6-hydroxymethyldihydropteridine diphosphokinase